MGMFDASRNTVWRPVVRFLVPAVLAVIGQACWPRPLPAVDYFLTLAGGYNPAGNQASLEANVLFFQAILREQHRGPRVHEIFFADGLDKGADLQVLSKSAQPKLPATELIASLHRRGGGGQRVEYRNHHVPEIAGALSPDLIHAGLKGIAKTAHGGDRLIVYVTAHGSEAKGKDPFNTTIDCWNNKSISVREFTAWLGELNPDVPVLMVMAQCYCGGFTHAIFDVDEAGTKTLSRQLRAGFFAQQHSLPAAGCRPDIDNDDEFSSDFWGTIAGRTRTGMRISGSDLDGDGRISFIEAYAHAVIYSNTIDIPLRASDIVLRTYSRLTTAPADIPSPAPAKDSPEPTAIEPAAEAERDKGAPACQKPDSDPEKSDEKPEPDAEKVEPKLPDLSAMTGTLQRLIEGERPFMRHIVTQLCRELGLALEDDVSAVRAAYDKHRRESRGGRGGFGGGFAGRGGRRGGGRPELLKEIGEKWPELADQQKWQSSPLLKADQQEKTFTELQKLASYEAFEQRRKQRIEASDLAEKNELKEIKYRRLLDNLEVIVLAKNLPLLATPEVVQRYRDMLTLEESSLNAATTKSAKATSATANARGGRFGATQPGAKIPAARNSSVRR